MLLGNAPHQNQTINDQTTAFYGLLRLRQHELLPLVAGLAGFPKVASLGVGGQQHVGVQPDNVHTLLAVSAHHKPGNAAL